MFYDGIELSDDFIYPGDEEKVDNEFREKGIEMIRIMSLAFSQIANAPNPLLTLNSICLAMGLDSVIGNKIGADIAREFNVDRAHVTGICNDFLILSGLPPSLLMKSEESRKKLSEAHQKLLID